MASGINADVGEAVNDAPWNGHPGAWADGLRLIADEVLQLPLNHNKELVFGRRDMRRRTETGRDGHVEDSEWARIGVNNLGGDSGEFRRFKFRCDTRFHFRSKRKSCLLRAGGRSRRTRYPLGRAMIPEYRY